MDNKEKMHKIINLCASKSNENRYLVYMLFKGEGKQFRKAFDKYTRSLEPQLNADSYDIRLTALRVLNHFFKVDGEYLSLEDFIRWVYSYPNNLKSIFGLVGDVLEHLTYHFEKYYLLAFYILTYGEKKVTSFVQQNYFYCDFVEYNKIKEELKEEHFEYVKKIIKGENEEEKNL